MRELVYLSDRKLEQFLPTLRSLWPRPKFGIKTPVVEIAVEPGQDAERGKLKQLARVIAHIERSARWFAAPEAGPGQWVHFEAPLNYLVLDGGPVPGMTLFVDRATPSADYPTAGATRLVLHCSGSHLRIEDRPRKIATPTGQEVAIPDPSAAYASGSGVFTANTINLLLSTLRSQPAPSDGDVIPPRSGTKQHLPGATAELLRAIDGRVHPETAAWMAGYARITANFTSQANGNARPVRYVIASPLYIEYASPPA